MQLSLFELISFNISNNDNDKCLFCFTFFRVRTVVLFVKKKNNNFNLKKSSAKKLKAKEIFSTLV